jgi:hypothetical protein
MLIALDAICSNISAVKVDIYAADRCRCFVKVPKRWLLCGFGLVLLLTSGPALGQSPIAEEKEVVAFIFATAHPINADKTPQLDANRKPVGLYMPLGTGFFVLYPDKRGGPDYGFVYLVTAKHVLRDFDGKFLRSVDVRVNLKSPEADSRVSFIRNVPVSDEHGKLLWYHGSKEADEAVAVDCLPDQKKVAFKTIPLGMFVDNATLKSRDVEEGDSLYFIGLMAQFYGSKKNFPVVRRGTLAMMTDEEIPTPTGPQKAFIAELQSWPGNSGSPVFLNLGGLRHGGLFLGENLRFLGILLGDFVNKIPATVVGGPQVSLGGNDAANVGISLIVPAASLRKVLDSPEAQSERDRQIRQLLKNGQPD